VATSLNLSGLASGIDTSSIVDQLMAIERQPRTKLQWNQAAVQARQSALKDVDTRLTNLLAAAKALRDTGTWSDVQTVVSSDDTRLSARRVAGAAPGPHDVVVSNLATSEQRVFGYTQSSSDTTITVGSKTFTILANTDVAGAAAAINSAADSPVYASVDSNGALRLASKQTGVANGFSASGSTIAEQTGLHVGPQDAAYTVDGFSYTSASNVTTTGLNGIELTLKRSDPATAITVTVGAPGPDRAAVKDKLKAFVDQYNSTVDFIKSKLDERKVANPANADDAVKGVLYADTALNRLLSQLRQGVSDVVSAGNPATMDEMAELGVSTGATTGGSTVSQDAIAGRLTFDETKFNAAFDAGSLNVRRLLGGISGTDGFAQRIEGLINPTTQTGGLLDGRQDSATQELKRITDSMTEMDQRLALKESRLKAQFAAMEAALAQSQSQGQWLTGQINGLSAQRG
jgi:flagellar hook-associated protein 2